MHSVWIIKCGSLEPPTPRWSLRPSSSSRQECAGGGGGRVLGADPSPGVWCACDGAVDSLDGRVEEGTYD